MLQIIKKELNISIITSIIYIILGIVVISNPEATINVIGKAIAILSILHGIAIVFVNVKNLREENTLVFGIITIVMGIILLTYPSSLSILISLAIGIWFIANSVARMKFAVLLKDVKEVNWILILLGSILTLIIGISFIFTPLSSAIALTAVSGIMMIAYSVIDIFEIIFVKKHIKEVERVLQ